MRSARFVLIAAAVALGGCGLKLRTPFVPVESLVPIATPVYCNVTIPENPQLPIAALHPTATPADTVRAYAQSIAISKAGVIERNQLIAACAPAAEKR